METTVTEGVGIVELFGHKRFGARVAAVEVFGAKMVRVEILGRDVVQFYAPSALFSFTPCPEDVATKLNANRWQVQLPELPAPERPSVVDGETEDEEGDDEEPGASDEDIPFP